MVLSGVTTLLHRLIPKQVAMPRFAANEFAGTGDLKALRDGFAGLVHFEIRKTEEKTGFFRRCKAETPLFFTSLSPTQVSIHCVYTQCQYAQERPERVEG